MVMVKFKFMTAYWIGFARWISSNQTMAGWLVW